MNQHVKDNVIKFAVIVIGVPLMMFLMGLFIVGMVKISHWLGV